LLTDALQKILQDDLVEKAVLWMKDALLNENKQRESMYITKKEVKEKTRNEK